jgi:hypothetical protein
MATAAQNRNPIAGNLDAMGKTLNERIAEAKAQGDTKEVERLTLASGITSAGIGLFTGIPDLAISGYNWATGSNIKELRTRVLEASGVPTAAPDEENQLTYDIPEYVAMAWGLKQLVQGGWKGFKNLRESKKIDDFRKTLPTQQANRFKQFMMNGQGSDDPMVIAALQQMRKDPTYAELFTTLDKAATKTAIKGFQPAAGARPQTATKQAVGAVQDRIEAVRQARNTAGDASFTKALALSGDRPLVKVDETLKALNELQRRSIVTDTPDSRKLAASIENLKQTFIVGEGSTDAKAMSVPQFQGVLAEFGKKVGSEDAVLKGLAQTDLEKINKAVTASLQTDLRTAIKALPDKADREAVGALLKARDEFAAGSQKYNTLISQGIPKFLQSKSLDEIDPEMLFTEYKKLNTGQRSLFREWVGERAPNALQTLDKKAFDNFLNTSYGKLDDGTQGYDLAKMSQNWEKIQKSSPDEADMLVKALGTNSAEFSGRMKDALVFTRKMRLGAPVTTQTQSTIGKLRKTVPAIVGSTAAGYQGTKSTDLAMQSAELLLAKKGLTPDQMMKALLTPEGAEFLKKAALSPNSRETLNALTKMNAALPTGRAVAAIGASQNAIAEAGVVAAESGLAALDYLNTNIQNQTGQDDDIFIPEDMAAPQTPVPAPMEEDDGIFIPEDMMPQVPVAPMSQAPMPQAAPVAAAGVMPMSEGLSEVSPEEEQAVRQVLGGMKQIDPNLNVDYVFNSYLRAAPAKRQQFMQLYTQK